MPLNTCLVVKSTIAKFCCGFYMVYKCKYMLYEFFISSKKCLNLFFPWPSVPLKCKIIKLYLRSKPKNNLIITNSYKQKYYYVIKFALHVAEKTTSKKKSFQKFI